MLFSQSVAFQVLHWNPRRNCHLNSLLSLVILRWNLLDCLLHLCLHTQAGWSLFCSSFLVFWSLLVIDPAWLFCAFVFLVQPFYLPFHVAFVYCISGMQALFDSRSFSSWVLAFVMLLVEGLFSIEGMAMDALLQPFKDVYHNLWR